MEFIIFLSVFAGIALAAGVWAGIQLYKSKHVFWLIIFEPQIGADFHRLKYKNNPRKSAPICGSRENLSVT